MISEIEPDVDMINEQVFDRIWDEVLDLDSKGLLENQIRDIQFQYNLHPDDDRDEILQLIAEEIHDERYN
jgi:hypothetical protein